MKKSLTFPELHKEIHSHIDMRMGETREYMIKEMIAEGKKELKLKRQGKQIRSVKVNSLNIGYAVH